MTGSQDIAGQFTLNIKLKTQLTVSTDKTNTTQNTKKIERNTTESFKILSNK